MSKNKLGNLRWIWLTLVILALDISSKAFVNHDMHLGQSVEVFPVLNIALAHNVGAAFNFLESAGGWQQWLFGILALFVSIIIFVWLWRMPRKANWPACALSLVLAGALGNLYDRLSYGYVGTWHWPAFNVADSAIVLGVIMLLLEVLFVRKYKTQ